MADENVKLSETDALKIRCARLNAEARAAEHRESLRVVEGLRLQREHLSLLLTRCAESLTREEAVAQQRSVADQRAQDSFAAARWEVGATLAPGREVFEDGSTAVLTRDAQDPAN